MKNQKELKRISEIYRIRWSASKQVSSVKRKHENSYFLSANVNVVRQKYDSSVGANLALIKYDIHICPVGVAAADTLIFDSHVHLQDMLQLLSHRRTRSDCAAFFWFWVSFPVLR